MSDVMDNDLSTVYAPRFAGFGVRLGAYIIDVLVLIPVIGASMYFTMFNPNALAFLLISILSAFYKPVLEGLYGATVGKMALKIKVVGAEGVPVTINQAFIRWVPFLLGAVFSWWFTYGMISGAAAEGISGFMEYSMYQQEQTAEMGATATIGQLSGLIPIISALFMLGNARKQAAHDKLAETYVIYRDQNSGSMS